MSERFSRQSFLGHQSEAALQALTVGVVGLGGGGSHIAQQLAHLGVGKLVLIDPDRVDTSNLNRLVGATERDARRKRTKVSVARRLIKGVNRDIHVRAELGRWQERAKHLRDCDLVFGCVDSFAARDELERDVRRFLIPYIDVGMDVHGVNGGFAIAGQVAVSLPGGPCLRCMNVINPDLLGREAAQYGQGGSRPQVVWPNGVLASMAIGLALALVTPWASNPSMPCLVEYDGNVPEVRPSSAVLHLARVQCPHFAGVEDTGDPWFGRRRENSD